MTGRGKFRNTKALRNLSKRKWRLFSVVFSDFTKAFDSVWEEGSRWANMGAHQGVIQELLYMWGMSRRITHMKNVCFVRVCVRDLFVTRLLFLFLAQYAEVGRFHFSLQNVCTDQHNGDVHIQYSPCSSSAFLTFISRLRISLNLSHYFWERGCRGHKLDCMACMPVRPQNNLW